MNVFLELHNSALYIYITFTSINIIEICKSCITTTELFSYYMKSAYFRKKKKCFAASAQNLIIRQENVIMPLSTAYHS